MNKVTDEYGLVLEGKYITVFIPATSRALVFRVKSRVNRGYEIINYGPLPLTAGSTLPTFEGGSVSVPADGVIPARAYTTGISFPMRGTFDETDMWYVPEDYRDRLFHVKQKITPGFLRVEVQIPVGVGQGRFQKGRVMVGVDKDFGFARGTLEVVHFPKIRYGYRYGNDANVNLRTFIQFVYAEYEVEIPKNASLIFDTLIGKNPSYWITMRINVLDPSIERGLTETYGILGFPFYRVDERDVAIKEYESLLSQCKI